MSVARCLDHLDRAIDAATTLGLDTTSAGRVRDDARARIGFAGDTYVLAMAGGTGVGKSTVLNALAGEEVSPASARRPTTGEPVAWIPATADTELSRLLDWLGVGVRHEHRHGLLGDVAVIDLPDFDSIAPEHRARVDDLLPRVDAVVWIVDPEKYKDELLHSSYLRTWAPRLARQLVVLNRADLLRPGDADRVRADLLEQLRREELDGIDVAITSAREGTSGIAELRAWLDAHVEAKRVVAERVTTAAGDAIRELGERAGVTDAYRPLIDAARQERALRDAARGVLALVDVPGLERQAVAATRLSARRRGAGPLGLLTSGIYRLAGRARASADPAGHLRRWRLRGSLATAVEPLRELVATALPAAPPELRRTLAARSAPGVLDARLEEATDRAVAGEAADFRVPTSWVWSVIGAGQYLVTAALVFAAIWFAALFVVSGVPTGSIALPYLGPVPTPVVLLTGALLAGYVLALALGLHAGWRGRRWARRVADAVTREVRERVNDTLLVPFETMELARKTLAEAARASAAECAVERRARL